MTLAFLDTNVFLYAMGAPHWYKSPCLHVLELAERADNLITGSEVFQEIIHRQISIRRWTQNREAFHLALELMAHRIKPMLAQDVTLAANLADRYPSLSSRDLIHTAVMMRVGARYIVSADTGFDAIAEVERLDPLRVDEWREFVVAG
jgi:predicted nucleic acid-binding protein